MQQYNSREEREIDLIDIMWKLFMQWKPIACTMIICGVLVAGVMYIRNARNIESQEIAKAQMTEEDMVGKLTEEEYEGVVAAYNILKQRDAVRKYAEESLYLQVDPYSEEDLSISYRVDTVDETSYSVVAMYSTLLGSDEFVGILAEAVGYTGDLKYIREMFTVSTPGIESSSLVFSFNFTLLPEMEADVIEKLVDDYVTGKAYEQISAMKDFTVTKVARSVKSSINAGTTNTMMDYDAKLKTLNTNLKTAEDALTEDQKNLYEYMTEQDGGAKDDTESPFKSEEEETVVMATSGLIKYLVIGCFLGAFLYGGCVLLFAIFCPKLQTVGEMADIYRLYLIDELHDRKFKGALQRFLYDKNIYELRYRKANRDVEKSVGEAVRQISGLAERDGRKKVYLAPMGKGFLNGRPADYFAKVEKGLAAAGVTVEKLGEDDLRNEILAVPEQAGIVALANVGDTRYASLDGLCGYAHKYEIELMGVVALEI